MTTKKPGRPPKDTTTGAMTDADRARAYRQRRKKVARLDALLAGVDEVTAERVSTQALIDALRACVTRHEKANGLRVLRVIGQRLQELPDQPTGGDLDK